MHPDNQAALKKFAQSWPLNSTQAEQLALYVQRLEDWSKHTNLVSHADVGRIVSRHIADSRQFGRAEILDGAERLLDLGSGAGFPGIPLKILVPELHVILLDSRRKKAIFLTEIVDLLALENVTVVCDRAEYLTAEAVGPLSCIVSRAVASLVTLWSWSLPLLSPGTAVLVQKGGDVEKERQELDVKFPGIRCRQWIMDEFQRDSPAARYILKLESKP